MIKQWTTGGGEGFEYQHLSFGAYSDDGKEHLGVTVQLSQYKWFECEILILCPMDGAMPIEMAPRLIEVLEHVRLYEEETRKNWRTARSDPGYESLDTQVEVSFSDERKRDQQVTFKSIIARMIVPEGMIVFTDRYERWVEAVLDYFPKGMQLYVTGSGLYLQPDDLPHLASCINAALEWHKTNRAAS